MSWSLGEITALSVKAARGAGLSWGLAEEAGWAVRFLAGSNLPGPEALAARLTGLDGRCPIETGTRLSDTGQAIVISEGPPIAQPLLLLPFLSALATGDQAINVTIGSVIASISKHRISLHGSLPPSGIASSVTMSSLKGHSPLTRRIDRLDPMALETLKAFAAKTYAPATDASRLRGAGAGLSDND